ncbi:MAG: imidazole glycerol phosphate synthase subunit HisF [Actinomycetaceae bacterium]|nr:imidazole glycerol phosphate synthase subunit HisF [Actinomycetaceae bacterium]
MTLAVRVIACLDVADGRVVKGVNFTNLRDAGDPVELARVYDTEGVDELTFLDISASHEGRGTTLEMVSRTAENVFIPLTVGGGVRSVEDVNTLLAAGADKVGVNTAALANPDLIDQVARKFGNQVLVLSVDARRCPPGVQTPSGFEVTTHGGRRSTGIDALEWVQQAQDRGVGEVLLNSMDADGVQNGFDTEMISRVCEVAQVPVIASGGAGKASHFVDAVAAGAQAVLAASVFHFKTVSVAQVKTALAQAGYPVRGFSGE